MVLEKIEIKSDQVFQIN